MGRVASDPHVVIEGGIRLAETSVQRVNLNGGPIVAGRRGASWEFVINGVNILTITCSRQYSESSSSYQNSEEGAHYCNLVKGRQTFVFLEDQKSKERRSAGLGVVV
jgi:hypothetical protein